MFWTPARNQRHLNTVHLGAYNIDAREDMHGGCGKSDGLAQITIALFSVFGQDGLVRRTLLERGRAGAYHLGMTKPASFRYFKTSPEIIRLAAMLYIRFPLSLRNVEDLLHERGIDVSHETVRYWWNRFGPMFASEIRRKRVQQLRAFSKRKWHVDEVFVKVNGKRHYLWRAVDHEGEVLEAVVTKRRNKAAALKFLKKLMKRHGKAEEVVTDRFASYKAALRDLTALEKQQTGRWLNNRVENSHLPFRRRERAMQRFRRMRSLQKFASVHSSVYNHFNQERSLTSRDIFKLTRNATLTEWREFGAG